MKYYSTAIKEAIANGNTTVNLIDMNLSGGLVRVTDSMRDKVLDGNTYLATGLVLSVGDRSQQQQLQVQDFDLQFTAADQTIPALFYAANQQGRLITIREVILASDDQTVLGTLSTNIVQINKYDQQDSDNGDATFAVNCSNFMSRWNAVKGMRTVQSSHQQYFPSSTSFINSKDIKDELEWGKF